MKVLLLLLGLCLSLSAAFPQETKAAAQSSQNTRWIEPYQPNGQVYLFAWDQPSMNWYEAQNYCDQQNAILAEPESSAVAGFLFEQATTYPPGHNWHLGLRAAERCTCVSPFGARSPARIDKASLILNEGKGFVRTFCSSNEKKECQSGRKWIWASSQKEVLSFNWGEGEPNGAEEHCVVMWHRIDNRWADSACSRNEPEGNAKFLPVCQKSKDEETSGQSSEAPLCLEANVIYRHDKNEGIIEKSSPINSHQECRQKCLSAQGCKYWTWRGDTDKKNCIIFKEVKSRNYKVIKTGAFSGTVTGNCKGNTGSSTGGASSGLPCVQYDVHYEGGDEYKKVPDVADANLCRVQCLLELGQSCRFYTWQKNRQRCILSKTQSWRPVAKRNWVSGTVDGICKSEHLGNLTDCKCHDLDNPNGPPTKLNSQGRCPRGQSKTCYASANIGIRSGA